MTIFLCHFSDVKTQQPQWDFKIGIKAVSLVHSWGIRNLFKTPKSKCVHFWGQHKFCWILESLLAAECTDKNNYTFFYHHYIPVYCSTTNRAFIHSLFYILTTARKYVIELFMNKWCSLNWCYIIFLLQICALQFGPLWLGWYNYMLKF